MKILSYEEWKVKYEAADDLNKRKLKDAYPTYVVRMYKEEV